MLIPAFMISELRRAFEIGFLIVLPFLVIDMIVATLTMSMGMMMLPPTVISLPFKVLFFVLIDGWNLLIGGSDPLFCLIWAERRATALILKQRFSFNHIDHGRLERTEEAPGKRSALPYRQSPGTSLLASSTPRGRCR